MAYHFENIKLEKGMYGRSSRSFSQALEELDPSEHYRGTPLEARSSATRLFLPVLASLQNSTLVA